MNEGTKNANELDDVVGIAASARVQELRVDEFEGSTEQGEPRVRRRGLPKNGAEPGVTYHDVEVSVEVRGGRPPREAPPRSPSPPPARRVK
jgi:hypothetical protein